MLFISQQYSMIETRFDFDVAEYKMEDRLYNNPYGRWMVSIKEMQDFFLAYCGL